MSTQPVGCEDIHPRGQSKRVTIYIRRKRPLGKMSFELLENTSRDTTNEDVVKE
jgi:hypothetical protein